jgi:hypothetical protein
VVLSLDQNEVFEVHESFEIKSQHLTGHAPGLVIVLDRKIDLELSVLSKMDAIIRLPDGISYRFAIDEAKDHLIATSLFFSGRTSSDVPDGAKIVITTRRVQ